MTIFNAYKRERKNCIRGGVAYWMAISFVRANMCKNVVECVDEMGRFGVA